jgi:hypothetical protein
MIDRRIATRLSALALFALACAASSAAKTLQAAQAGEGQGFDTLLAVGAFVLAAIALLLVLPRGSGKRKRPDQLGTDQGPDED